MSQLGALLEAVHDAPRATSFVGSARQGQDPARMQQFVERLNRRGGARSVGHVTQASWGEKERPPGFVESTIAFWYCEGQGRVDQDGSRFIGVPGKSFRYSPNTGGIVSLDERQRSGPFGQFGPFFKPASLLGFLQLRIVDTPELRGRSSWHVAAEELDTVGPSIPRWIMAGEDVELWFDQELGIVVRYEGRFEGESISRFEVDDLMVGQSIDPAL